MSALGYENLGSNKKDKLKEEHRFLGTKNPIGFPQSFKLNYPFYSQSSHITYVPGVGETTEKEVEIIRMLSMHKVVEKSHSVCFLVMIRKKTNTYEQMRFLAQLS